MPLRDTNIGDAGMESGYDCELSNDLDCSLSETSEESGELTNSSEDPRTGKLCDVRSTGLLFLPRRSLEGLPGTAVDSFSLYFLGSTIEQLSQTSGSESKVLLGLLLAKLSVEEKLGK